jgi:actin-like ATPase involved in cell morphogenesis
MNWARLERLFPFVSGALAIKVGTANTLIYLKDTGVICNETVCHIALVRLIPLQLKRRGVETRMVLAGETTPSRVELPLLKAVARARRWALELISEQVNSV